MLTLLLAIAMQAEATQDLAQFGPLPRDVAAFIDRRTSCNHFAGEFNGDRRGETPQAPRRRARGASRAQRDA